MVFREKLKKSIDSEDSNIVIKLILTDTSDLPDYETGRQPYNLVVK